METKRRILLRYIPILLICQISGCGNTSKEGMENVGERVMTALSSDEAVESLEEVSYAKMEAPVVSSDYAINFFTSKATSAINDGSKKFIRTSNIRFKVKDVISATHSIEDIILSKKGFIIGSSVSDNNLYSNEIPISEDSLLEQTFSKLSGQLTLRVHHSLLDASLREIAPLAEQIYFRTVKAEEVTFRIMEKELERERKNDKSLRVKNLTRSSGNQDLEDKLTVEDAIDLAREQADNALIASLQLQDEIEYSTITISLEQDQRILTKVKARNKDVEMYKKGFFHNIKDGFVSGWNGLLELLAILVELWPVILILSILGYIVVRFYRKKRGAK